MRSKRTRRSRARALGPRAAPFVVVTGLSGAGKSHALRALEDLGYFCVDNLPVTLIPRFAELTLGGKRDIQKAAVVVDVREGRELVRFPAVYRRLKRRYGRRVRLVFLQAAEASLIRRFSETRRPHPLGAHRSVTEGLAEERRLLQPIRLLADQAVDTSRLTVHELRRRIGESTRGTPADADAVFDVRFLPNPHWVASLRRWTGRHAPVARYVLGAPAARRFLTLTSALLEFLIPQYIAEGKTYLTVAIGCTGGRHRSVAITEALAKRLRRMKGVRIRVTHRDIDEG
jgi:RNase adapter protein RapZ